MKCPKCEKSNYEDILILDEINKTVYQCNECMKVFVQ